MNAKTLQRTIKILDHEIAKTDRNRQELESFYHALPDEAPCIVEEAIIEKLGSVLQSLQEQTKERDRLLDKLVKTIERQSHNRQSRRIAMVEAMTGSDRCLCY